MAKKNRTTQFKEEIFIFKTHGKHVRLFSFIIKLSIVEVMFLIFLPAARRNKKSRMKRKTLEKKNIFSIVAKVNIINFN